MIQLLRLNRLILDADIQPRETMSSKLIEEYAKFYREGHELPPIKAFKDGRKYWLADGFHRASAAREAELLEIAVDVEPGTKRDAILYACASNIHGKVRSNDDKRRAVIRMLKDDEWQHWSDRKIAMHCAISEVTVAKYRRELSPKFLEIRTVTRGDSTYEMDTSDIGRRPVPHLEIEEPPEPSEFPDDMDRQAIEAAFPEQAAADMVDAFDGLDEMDFETEKHPVIEPEPERFVSSYVLWVTLLRQVASLLEDLRHMGGIVAVMKELTPAQVEDVIGQAYRLDRHLRALIDEVDGMAMVVDIKDQSR
jgi:hypothetical protein